MGVESNTIYRDDFLSDSILKENYVFKSDTDTEVVAIELSKQWNGNLLETVVKVTKDLEGTYALVVIDNLEPSFLSKCLVGQKAFKSRRN